MLIVSRKCNVLQISNVIHTPQKHVKLMQLSLHCIFVLLKILRNCSRQCSSPRKLVILPVLWVSNCYCFAARGIVPVVCCSSVLSKGIGQLMLELARTATSPVLLSCLVQKTLTICFYSRQTRDKSKQYLCFSFRSRSSGWLERTRGSFG